MAKGSSQLISWNLESSVFRIVRSFCYLSLFLAIITSSQAETIAPVTLSSTVETGENFQKLESRSLVIHYGFQKDEVSFPLKVESHAEKPKSYYLIFLWSHLDEVEVCFESEPCQRAGYSHPVSTWPIPQIFPTFPLELKPFEKKQFEIHIRSKNFIESEIKLLTTEELFELLNWHTGLVFSFLILLVFFLIRLVYLTFQYRKLWMIYHIAFHFAIFLVFIFGSGLANYFLFPSLAIPLSLFKKIIIGVLIITGSAWLSNYLGTNSKTPITHRIYQVCMALAFLLMILSFTTISRFFISVCYTTLYLGVTILSLKLAISKLQDQLKPTPWLILSLLCLFLFEILNIFSYETFDSHDSKIYLFFLSVFLPANSFFVSRTIRGHIKEMESELTLTKIEIQKFKRDLDESLLKSNSSEKKTYLNGVNIERVTKKLTSLMTEDKIFLEEELRLSDLAALLGLSVHQTSEILNQILKISFVDLLKKYRIEEAKRLLIEEDQKSILDIALECGFTSKSVFNDAFRKNESITPQEFRKKRSQLYS